MAAETRHRDPTLPAEILLAICERMKQARKRAKLTQRETAEFIGVATWKYSRWERGESPTFLVHLGTVAEAFGTTEADLLGEHQADYLARPSATVGDLLRTLTAEVRALRADFEAVALRLGKGVPH